jgi:single-strand DNA-binding protein
MQFRGTVNEVEVIGWMGSDPEMRFTPQGTAVVTITVATKRPSHATGEIKTDWIQVEAWEKLAEQINTHLRKGSRVRVRGYLVSSSWEDRESGQRRSKMVVRAESVLFLDGRASTETENLLEEEQLEEMPF